MILEIIIAIVSNILTFPLLILSEYLFDRMKERRMRKGKRGKPTKKI